jgi:hypothetical protein
MTLGILRAYYVSWLHQVQPPDITCKPASAISGGYGGWTSVSPPEEHHGRRKFCRRGGNLRTCDSGSAIDS